MCNGWVELRGLVMADESDKVVFGLQLNGQKLELVDNFVALVGF
jgi:hypothetical protein